MTSEEKLAALEDASSALNEAWLTVDATAAALSVVLDLMATELEHGDDACKRAAFFGHCKGYHAILRLVWFVLEETVSALSAADDRAEKAAICLRNCTGKAQEA